MIRPAESPLFLIAIPFTLGVLGFSLLWLIPGISAMLLFMRLRKQRWKQILSLISVTVSAWVVGFSLQAFDSETAPQWEPTNVFGQKMAVLANPGATAYGYSALCQSNDFPGLVLLYMDSAQAVKLKPGYDAQLSGRLSLAASRLSGYSRYLKLNRIYLKLTVKELSLLGPTTGFPATLLRLKDNLVSQIHTYIPGEVDAGVAAALLLGERSGLESGLKSDYNNSGAAHILAISGMHITLILVFIGFAATRLAVGRIRGWALVLIAILIAYGLLSGGSPSVMRAVIMSSVTLMAGLLYRKAYILNTLGLAWILQLVLEPRAVYDVGLELSYAAVLGIVLAEPLISAWLKSVWPAKGREIRFVKETLSVTLAAQLFTLPIVLVVFGRFPPYFILTNLLAIPVSSLATLLGFLFLVVCKLPGLNQLMGLLFGWSIHLLNEIIHFMASLPGASLRNLFLPTWAAWALGVLLFLWVVLMRRQAKEHFAQGPVLL